MRGDIPIELTEPLCAHHLIPGNEIDENNQEVTSRFNWIYRFITGEVSDFNTNNFSY